MKKFFSLCMMSMAVATMSAQTQEVPFTVSPEPGVVESLNSVVLELDSDSEFAELDVVSSSGIYFIFNGTIIETKANDYDEAIEIVPKDPIAIPGEYTLVIEAGAISWWTPDYSSEIENQELTLTYILEGEAPVVGDNPFTVDPAPESYLEELPTVTFTLVEGYSEFEVNDSDAIHFLLNSAYFCDAKSSCTKNTLTIAPKDAPSAEPGFYQLVIPEGAICWYTEDYTPIDNPEEIVISYMIGGDEPFRGDYPFTVSPTPDTEIEVLDMITLSLPLDGDYIMMEPDTYMMHFEKDGEIIPAGVNADTYDDLTWYITPNEPITEAGNYSLVIEAGAIWYLTVEEEEANNYEDIVINYTVIGGAEPAEPVVYDVIPSAYNPKDGAEIDLEMKNFDQLTITVTKGIRPAEGAYITVMPVGYEAEAIEAPLTYKDNGMNQIRAEFANQEYNGEYIIIIPEGSFGDEAWLNDPEYGHSNPEIELTVTVVNGAERVANISYTLEAEVTWTEDLKSFTLTFPEGTYMGQYAFATLAGVDTSYSKYGMFADSDNSTFTVEFDEAPVESGKYIFHVGEGSFGDAEFIASDEEAGVANAEIEITIDYSSVGIKTVNSDNAKAGVYNLFGVKVADSPVALPAGIYVVNGKKVVIK